MRKIVFVLGAALIAAVMGGPAHADGISGSTECHIQDDDCDGRLNEDTGTIADDNDGDGAFDEDPPGDANGDLNPDDDLDGLIDEDPADDDGDGAVDEDPPGDAADDAGENQVDCNESSSQDVGGLFYLYAAGDGVEACADDGSSVPVDGRIIVTTDQGGYAAADGDASNSTQAQGYVRVDGNGVHCGDENNSDSTADQSQNTAEDCNAEE